VRVKIPSLIGISEAVVSSKCYARLLRSKLVPKNPPRLHRRRVLAALRAFQCE
jgi:hypothetical protein